MPFVGAAFPEDGSRVLTWSGVTARMWDPATSRQIGPALAHGDTVLGAEFTKDASRILTWYEDGAVLWDAITGKQLGPVLAHDNIRLRSGATFSNDERRVLTWSALDGVRQWDVSLATMPASDLLREVCTSKLRGNSVAANELLDEGGKMVRKPILDSDGEAVLRSPRLLDAFAVDAAPVLRGREGENVCAGLDPPWYDGVLGLLFGWAFR